MQLFKVITTTLLFAMSSLAVAAPSPNPNPLEGRIAELERRTEKMVARADWTCAFGGNEACHVKCVAEGHAGGYCASDDVCTCISA